MGLRSISTKHPERFNGCLKKILFTYESGIFIIFIIFLTCFYTIYNL